MNKENRKAGRILRHSEITEQAIAAAIRVHRELGPGLLESIYEELQDIHFAVGRSYLKATNLQDGLLLNLATTPLTIKRFCRERPESHSAADLLK